MPTRLSVNINKVAVIRNSRGGKIPDVIQFAIDCERFGADGITVHPRPDERHIRYDDVLALKNVVTTEFNIEGYPDQRFLDLVKKVKPAQATLVPDPPDVITSNAGWDVKKNMSFLQDVIAQLKENNIRISIFLDPVAAQVHAAKESGTHSIELYTGPYAEEFAENKEHAVKEYAAAGKLAHDLGIAVNAGHDLNLLNLHYFRGQLPFLAEVSIGHAIISDALYFGIENTIQLYKRQLL